MVILYFLALLIGRARDCPGKDQKITSKFCPTFDVFRPTMPGRQRHHHLSRVASSVDDSGREDDGRRGRESYRPARGPVRERQLRGLRQAHPSQCCPVTFCHVGCWGSQCGTRNFLGLLIFFIRMDLGSQIPGFF
jgi:hypothetical protein